MRAIAVQRQRCAYALRLTTFVDGGMGEDYDSYTTSYGYVLARRELYWLECDGESVGSGVLSSMGRTTQGYAI